MHKPLVIDLYCGLGGWTEAFLAEGWDAIGFDIERHNYGTGGYPGQLVLQDVCTLHGAQLVDADCLVASSPCQEFSYRAMPWKRAKAQVPEVLPDWWTKAEGQMNAEELAAWKQWRQRNPADPPVLGINLFWQAFRIQQELFEACGRYVPLIAENVRGAQPWVGKAVFNYGSFYLWGDVPPLMPCPNRRAVMKNGVAHRSNGETNFHGSAARKNGELGGGSWFAIGGPGQIITGMNPDGRKVASESGRRTDPGNGTRFTTRDCGPEKGFAKLWRDSPSGMPMMSSRPNSRKAASAMIAKIPQSLAVAIAQRLKPQQEPGGSGSQSRP